MVLFHIDRQPSYHIQTSRLPAALPALRRRAGVYCRSGNKPQNFDREDAKKGNFQCLETRNRFLPTIGNIAPGSRHWKSDVAHPDADSAGSRRDACDTDDVPQASRLPARTDFPSALNLDRFIFYSLKGSFQRFVPLGGHSAEPFNRASYGFSTQPETP